MVLATVIRVPDVNFTIEINLGTHILVHILVHGLLNLVHNGFDFWYTHVFFGTWDTCFGTRRYDFDPPIVTRVCKWLP